MKKVIGILAGIAVVVFCAVYQQGISGTLEDSPTIVTDTSWRTPYLIDNFEYLDSPLNHNWEIFDPDPGATLTTVYDPTLASRVMRSTTTEGTGFGIYYPKTAGGIGNAYLGVYKRYLYFYLKTTSLTFNSIVKINRQDCATNHIVYRLINGNPTVSGDSIIIPLGTALADGQWHEIIRDLSADLHKGFTGEALNTYFVALRGDYDIDSLILRNRSFIEGYADSTSIAQGKPLNFKVSINRPGAHTFRIEFYREGASREFKFSTGQIPETSKVVPDSAWRYGAVWPTSYTLSGSTSLNWKSGMYVAKLISDLNDSSFVPFVVREDNPGSTSNILLQLSTTTYQAYNNWGGGSFYAATPDLPLDTVVSFDRPYNELWFGPWSDGTHAGQFYGFELPFIRWFEGQGYTAEYADNISINDPLFTSTQLQKYRLFLSVGHDEYWYEPARDKLELTFRNNQHNNLAFFSANTCFWRVREPSPNPQRKMIRSTGGSYNDMWRSLVTNGDSTSRPEARFIGIQYTGPNVRGRPATVRKASHWIMQGTGLQNGSQFGFGQNFPEGISGYEKDVVDTSSPVGLDTLAESSPVGQCLGNPTFLAQTTYYKHAGGSEVFASGGIQWSWGLSDADGGTAKITKNVIDGFASAFRGHITQNATWSGNIYLGGDVTIDAGVTVTINPGTKIYFFPNNDVERTGGNSNKTELIVKGTLTCLGSQTDSIILTSASTGPVRGDWGGVRFTYPGRGEVEFTRFSYADTALAVWGDTATVIVYNSTFEYFNKAAVFSKSAKTKLGGIFPLPNPPDCGKNNFLMNTATSGAKAVIKSSVPSGTLKAEGNWWTQTPPQSNWFSGNVDRTPYLLGYATPDSCGGNPGQSPPPPGGRISVKPTMPVSFELGQNYPNPFNPTTTIQYALPEPAKVELKIYNILGQLVRKLVNEEQPVGYHQTVWDGKDENGRSVSTGVYLYQIKAGDFVKTMKMSFIK